MTGTAEATVTRALSRDGTAIAYWTTGEGPPLVLAHGSMCDHTAFDPLVAELRDAMTTFAMDRRGFGASGDAAGYALEREFEDVAAVVEAVAARTGGPVALWGHSYGAGCAMGGAALTDAVHRLVLYEPELGIPYPAGSIEEVEAALTAGDAESHPVLREATDRALAAIPGARVEVLEGHAHLAYRSDPAMVAAVIREFVSGSAAASGARPGAGTRPG
jgi:pimeloyl-ACP methyl ester carboxylesterase